MSLQLRLASLAIILNWILDLGASKIGGSERRITVRGRLWEGGVPRGSGMGWGGREQGKAARLWAGNAFALSGGGKGSSMRGYGATGKRAGGGGGNPDVLRRRSAGTGLIIGPHVDDTSGW